MRIRALDAARGSGRMSAVVAVSGSGSAGMSLVDPTSPAGVTPAGNSGYTGALTFSDEFNAPVDWEKWDPAFPAESFYMTQSPVGNLSNNHGTSPGGDEPQIYDPSAVSVVDGAVRFTMRDESQRPDLAPSFPFTSGMLSSYVSFSQTGGWFEARARCVNIAGSWPAAWLLSAQRPLAWPPEVDLFENFGEDGSSNNVITFGSFFPNTDHPGGYTNLDPSEWHTYGARVVPGDRIEYWVDGVLQLTTSRSDVTDDPMYVIVNLAGYYQDWPDPADMPFAVDFDYVRVWAEEV